MPVCTFSPESEDYEDFIIRYSLRSLEHLFSLPDPQCVNIINREFAIIHTASNPAAPLSIARYTYEAIPKLYGLLDTTALESSGILPLFDQPVLRATGRGVLLGVIDTGIDYTNPLFRNPDGSSRILRIWDQTVVSEEPPEPISGFQPFYGTVYDQQQINDALETDDPLALVPTTDTNGHGTFLAGVAAGNRTETTISFSGAAPEAALAVVKLKPAKQYLRDFFLIRKEADAYQENDIMTAVAFLIALATEQQMPVVILLGLGTAQGSHDGALPLGRQLQALGGYPGFAAVIGAGNEVGYHHHFLGNLTADQSFEDVELRVGSNETGFCAELWAFAPELYTIGFVSPSGEVIDRIPLALGTEIVIPFRLDRTSITVNYVNYESGSGSQLIFMRFQAPSPGIWHIRVYPTTSAPAQFHIWLPMHGFLSDETVFLRPNPDTTITDPGNAVVPLTVSTYDHVSGSIYIHSSRGYTRNNNRKPDLAAPGVNVQGPSLPPAQSAAPAAPNTARNANSASNTAPNTAPASDAPPAAPAFTRRTGSSVAAAIAAGAMADLFTWAIVDRNEPSITSISAKSMLIRGADRSPAYTYPNREWGYGTLNLQQSIIKSRE